MEAVDCSINQVVFETGDLDLFLRHVRDLADLNGTHIVLFDADKMAGKAHVQASLSHAWRPHINGTGISNSFEMEALLYAAGSRQCLIAGEFGIHEGKNRSYLCICPPNDPALDAMRSVVEFDKGDWEFISPEKRDVLMNLFAITPEELEVSGQDRIADLVCERVALLKVLK